MPTAGSVKLTFVVDGEKQLGATLRGRLDRLTNREVAELLWDREFVNWVTEALTRIRPCYAGWTTAT